MKSEVSVDSVVVASKRQVSSDLGGEAAILDLEGGVYYGLDEVGARIWEMIQEPRPASEVRDALLEEYDVEPERCERDLLALLERLAEGRLIEVVGEAPA